MSQKKSKKPLEPKPDFICKVEDCGAKAKREGFCSTCYLKFNKGLILENGQKSGKAVASERKRKEKERQRKWEDDTQELKELLSVRTDLLKVIQTDYPETLKTLWCDKIGFWSCEAACFNRMFVLEVPPDESCTRCHQHDSRFDWLKQYIGTKNAQK